MKIYNYSSATGAFTGIEVARESPLEPGKFLIPAFCSTVVPPTAGLNQIPVMRMSDGSIPADGSLGAWSLIPDHCGEVWYDQAGNEIVIDHIGLTPDPSWVSAKPSPTIAQQWAAYQSACLNELNRITSTMQRIALAVSLGAVAASDPVVQQWVAYQKNLRAQLSAAQPATIPAMPQIPVDSTGKVIYPANT